MSRPDLDRYYTPPAVARSIVEASGWSSSGNCLDSTCGDGSLLSAANDLLPNVRCVGIDVDRSAIARLRRRYPSWTLSRGDALNALCWDRLQAGREGLSAELALLNPPFSMGARKGIALRLDTFDARCSVAMAHVLTVLKRVCPAVCCAVVPESLLYSEVDAQARIYLGLHYETFVVEQLRNSTFRGTRANAVVVRFRRRHRTKSLISVNHTQSLSSVVIVRGGLPVHEARRSRSGVAYVHSTDLPRLTTDGIHTALQRVRGIERGRLSGDAILLPRVGMPLRLNIRAVVLDDVQLSDCVIALSFRSPSAAVLWESALRGTLWPDLLSKYHGTGARYVTVGALFSWLCEVEREVHRGAAADTFPLA